MTRLPDSTQPLSADAAAFAFDALLDGQCAAEDIARFLTDMSLRDETALEIAAAVRAEAPLLFTPTALAALAAGTPPVAVINADTGADAAALPATAATAR